VHWQYGSLVTKLNIQVPTLTGSKGATLLFQPSLEFGACHKYSITLLLCLVNRSVAQKAGEPKNSAGSSGRLDIPCAIQPATSIELQSPHGLPVLADIPQATVMPLAEKAFEVDPVVE
jgi:hypothetical protein